MQLGDKVATYATSIKKIFEKGDWKVYLFKVKDKDKLPQGFEKCEKFFASGVFPTVYDGQTFELIGNWKRNKNDDLELAVKCAIPSLPTTREDALVFVKNAVKGIGPKFAKQIVDWCNGDIEKVSADPVACTASIKNLSERRVRLLAAKIDEASATAALTRLLKKMVEPQVIRKLVKAYGAQAYKKVTETPYDTVKVIGFSAADKIALALDYKPMREDRIEAAILSSINELRSKNCSIVVPKAAQNTLMMRMLTENLIHVDGKTQNIDQKAIDDAIYKMKQDRTIAGTKGPNGFLYLREDFDMEKHLTTTIIELGKIKPNDTEAANFCAAFEEWKSEHSDIHLHENQAAAVFAASNPFSVVTGGPGTGKTTVLKAIMETYEKVYPDNPITLMAPTGLAAKRMTESCERPARTIHKALGLVPADTSSGFAVPDDEQKLPGGLIIVDEFSMVGIHLTNFLLSSIEFKEGTHVVFVGDVDQLPSVSPGVTLRDLIECGKVHVTRLTQNFRQASGSNIADVAVKVNTGNRRDIVFGNDCIFTEVPEAKIAETIIAEFKKSVEEFGFDNTYVITPTHKSETDALSSNSLNKVLQDVMNPHNAQTPEVKVGSWIFRVGDRVINKKNSEKVINGDIGKIVGLIPEDVGVTLKVDFNGEIVEFPTEKLKNLELAYAITVHSSQGCEFKSVIMPISYSHRFMLTRNLVYTAITRAKKKMHLIGNMASMLASVENTKTGAQSDLLCARLMAS